MLPDLITTISTDHKYETPRQEFIIVGEGTLFFLNKNSYYALYLSVENIKYTTIPGKNFPIFL
jgi:hypothetical protein